MNMSYLPIVTVGEGKYISNMFGVGACIGAGICVGAGTIIVYQRLSEVSSFLFDIIFRLTSCFN